MSYLNAKPLIDGIEQDAPGSVVRFDVPSGLLADLERGEVDVALCPVIDYFRSAAPLAILPVGGIGCDGPTLTVRIYSQVPLEQVEAIHADTDSHTSVALMRVLMRWRLGRDVTIRDFDARQGDRPPTMLLIGDKVVTDSPAAVRYPHQLDLGEAWKEATGLPFVFAVWMCRAESEVDALSARLEACRGRNALRIPELVRRHAPRHGWPLDLAERYLGELLRYEVGSRQLEAMTRFGREAAAVGVIATPRPLVVYGADRPSVR